ncbi:hypothetical protein Vadar_019523 [Vaccinium darrowii]|uniref:Uncharacterized protein n=1 Tax=Vaccinium darrowii TaxID=229202 RepID=A0ACB7YWR8_9ERIC|nr:hypothetical protein Vadar_019523 [Vaccinium darrowii]
MILLHTLRELGLAKRARGRPALPRQQPEEGQFEVVGEQAEEGQFEEEEEVEVEVEEHFEEGQPEEEVHLAAASSGVGIRNGEDVPRGGPLDRGLLKSFDTHVAAAIWNREERGTLRLHSHSRHLSKWRVKSRRVQEKINNSGLGPLCSNLTYPYCNAVLVSAFVERWHPETNTFHFKFGEMGMTLDDTEQLLGLSVIGKAVHTEEEYRDPVTLLKDCLGVSETDARKALNGGKSVALSWLKKNFTTVSKTDSVQRVDYCARAYLLFVLGCTLFIDKSGGKVDVSLLSLLSNLDEVDTYGWGTGCLAYLYRQLGTASRKGVKQLCGYTTLLEAWIHEHFPTLQQPQNPNYSEELPRAHRWLPRREASNVSVSHYRRMLDDLRADQVIFDPYKDRRGDVRPIAFYTGPIRGMSVVEPYLPDRVLRQFGLVQIIPGDPIAPARVETGDKKYNVVYTWTDANWTSWEYHVVPEVKRVRTKADVPWECHPDYAQWLSRYSHFTVSPDAGATEVNIDGSATDGLKLAAITQEVDKVFAEGLSPYSMREALRHISSILRPTIRGEPRTPRTTEGATYGRRTDAT